MIKRVIDFSFEEAKSASIHRISQLADFMENMNFQKPDKIPLDWAITLRTLELKINGASRPCLKEVEIQQIIDLAYQLTQANPDTTYQLTEFWKLYAEILRKVEADPNTSGYELQGIIMDKDNWSKFKNSDSIAESLVSEIKKSGNAHNYTSINAILNSHLSRTEKIEHLIRKQLNDAVKTYHLKGYDIDTICSVRHKVKKGNGWKTDVRAIRDSIAHFKYTISPTANGFEITFDNNEEGYNFHERFSSKEFYHFFDLHTVLYKLQLHLLIIIELLPILTTCLLKKPIAS